NHDRLVGVTNGNNDYRYQYNVSGTRTSSSKNGIVTAYTIDPMTNRVTAVEGPDGKRTIAYDSSGNVLTDGITELTYNSSGRVSNITNAAHTAHYQYNAQNQRIVKIVDGIETHFIYDNDFQLLAEHTPHNDHWKEYVWYEGKLIAFIDKTPTQTATYYVWTDNLGTPRY
ncbi:hypothetical protein R7036_26710, partial [Vibrio sp. 1637]